MLPWAAPVVALALARGAFLAVLVPPFQSPDEPAHFDYVQRLAEVGRLADPGTPGGRLEGTASGCDELSPESEALRGLVRASFFHRERPVPSADRLRLPPDTPQARFTPLCSSASVYGPLYYLVAAGAYLAVHDAPLPSRLLAARLSSVLWGALGALAAFLAGLWLFGDARSGFCLGLAYALQPMQSLMFSTVNNDAALYAATAAAFAAAARRYRDPASRGAWAAFALASIVAAMAKPTFLLVVPALLVAFATASGPRRRASWFAGALALLPAIAVGVAWQFWHASSPWGAPAATASGGPIQTFPVDFPSASGAEALWGKYYWMNWGWHDLRLPIAYYRWLEILLVLALLGCILGWRRFADDERGLIVVVALGTLAMLLPLYGLAYQLQRATGESFLQGRYLLPLFVPQAAAIMAGLRGLARRVGASEDPAFALPLALAMMVGASALHGLARYYA